MAIFDYNVCCYVPTNVVYVASMRMDDICRMLRNLLVHKKDNSCLFKKTKQQTNAKSRKANKNLIAEKAQ